VIFDVGITRKPDKSKKSGYKLYGDVNFEQVKDKAAFVTPVPGGVGPMTIVSLLKNTILAAKGK
jgi:methylenetetrahydrofolate dehydrogenase (NADP+)/methenyltetrahydrofolate cyclohydrolase